MPIRKYSSRSQQTTLTAGINSSVNSATVVSGSALLGGITISAGEIFTVVIDPDTALEEIVDVTAVSTNTLTILRAIDGSTAQSHSAGAVVRHMAIGRDYREANAHVENVTTAHGLTIANVLETTDTNMITTAMLQASAVTTAKIADSNVTTAKIADSAITSAKIADLTIATGDIADSAITSGKIATGAVGTTKIDDLSITTGKIVDSAITSAKIADGTIVAGDIADGAITSAKILDGTIANVDINSSAQIAYSKLALTNGIVNADINASAAIDKTKISGTAITAGDTGTVTSTMIADGTIVNTDINASAAIDWTKIAPSSTVSATELGYLDGVTSAVQTQLDSKLGTSTAASTYAPLASPALTGVPTAPTATAGTNTTQVATTAFVGTAVSNLVAAAPAALDTLNELAASLGNDANFATTVTNNLATKLPLAGGTMSGAIAMGTNKITGLGTPTSSTDAATKAYADTMLPLAGGAMSGAIAMGTNKITGVGNPTNAQDVVTKYYLDNVVLAPSNLTGPITSVGNVTSIASQTGTGTKFVVDTSPTLVTPVLGVATATSINGTTIPSSKTLVATDSTAYVVPSQSGNTGKFLTTDGTTSSWGSTLIESSGSIGIGTTSPGVKLDIIGPTGAVTAPTYPNQTSMAIRNNFHARIALVNGGSGTYSSEIHSFGPSAAHPTHSISMNPNGISLSTGSGTVATTERMRLGYDGLVGINGALAGAQFSVSNGTAANVGAIIKGASAQTGDLLQIQDSAATNLVRVTSAGNVGIGTVPSTKLHVNGVVTATSFTGYITGTNHGVIGNLGVLTPAASSQATWAAYPMGFAQMVAPTANGSPSTTNYTYFLKVSNRDNSGGWGGIAVDHNTGEFYTGVTSTSATYATWRKFAFVANRNDYATVGTLGNVVGQLAWKNFGNGHTIFDASNSTSPDGGAVNNTDAQVAWTSSYPTLMGWNGGQTYGVRVDIARKAEFDPKTQAATTPALRNISMGTAAPSGGVDGDVYIQYA